MLAPMVVWEFPCESRTLLDFLFREARHYVSGFLLSERNKMQVEIYSLRADMADIFIEKGIIFNETVTKILMFWS